MNGTVESEKFQPTCSESVDITAKKYVEKRSRNEISNELKRNFYQHDTLEHVIHLSNYVAVPRPTRRHLSDMMYIEHYENGGGYALHAYANELVHLTKDELNMFVQKFFRTLFTERRKRGISVPFSYYCIGVVHGAAKQMPEFLSYLSANYPYLNATTSSLQKKHSNLTISISEYAKNVFSSYASGIYRYGPLHALSLVGVKGEERGKYCQDILKMIEADPFLNCVTPWGQLSKLHGMDPSDSDDGPILWCRHGEQTVPVFSTNSVNKKSNSGGSDLADLLISRRILKGRQTSVYDRTPCHADHADDGLGRHTTAAIGLLKAIVPPSKNAPNSNTYDGQIDDKNESGKSNYYSRANYCDRPARIIKDVVVFDPRHYPELVERLRLDIMEPPVSQCDNFWADDGELNQLHAEGFRYVRLPIRDNDIYFIPRNVVHQFKTISAATSIAWHVRLKSYYDQTPDQKSPNHKTTNSEKANSKNGTMKAEGIGELTASVSVTQPVMNNPSPVVDDGKCVANEHPKGDDSVILQLSTNDDVKMDYSNSQPIDVVMTTTDTLCP